MGLIGLIFAFIVVNVLVLIPLAAVWPAQPNTAYALIVHYFFGVVIPYLAAAIFIAGLIYRILKWGQSPVPFRIPTTCGQEKSLPWVKTNPIDNPTNIFGVLIRMALEILLFRSLFRNMSLDFREGRATYSSSKWLWLFALAFHYSFLVVLIRHLRFFLEPVPWVIKLIENLDGFMQVGFWPFSWLPGMLLSGMVLLGAATYLFLRRLAVPQLRYISLSNDYFPLFMILAIGTTGVLMRYLIKVDVVGVKQLTMGLVNFSPTVPEGIGTIFYMHLFLISVFFAYFPFSKLMHLGGVFLSPTRNLVNNNRRVRHINPWNYEVKTHSYEEYEDEFRELMIEAGLPVEKEAAEAEEGVEDGATEA